MSRPRCLIIVSADFGEYVTASLFTRGQAFESRWCVPERLAPYCDASAGAVEVYRSGADLLRIATEARPDVVLLCSGYLFAVNGLMGLTPLRRLMSELTGRGAVIATTDPWFRIRAFRPEAVLTIRSIRKRSVDANATARISALQDELEALFRNSAHVLAVPLENGGPGCMPFFNPHFARAEAPASAAGRAGDEWLFVLSHEDFALLSGLEPGRFFSALEARVGGLLSRGGNRITFVGPPALGTFFAAHEHAWKELKFVPFMRFADFEAAVRRASVVVYWNVLSASLLYCLYYGVPPVFFGKGHQTQVCSGLYEHAVAHVYGGRPPVVLDLDEPLEPDPVVLAAKHQLPRWLSALRRDYEGLSSPHDVMARLSPQNAIG